MLIATTVDISLMPLPLFVITTFKASCIFFLTNARAVISLIASILEFVPTSSKIEIVSGLGFKPKPSITFVTSLTIFLSTICLISSY